MLRRILCGCFVLCAAAGCSGEVPLDGSPFDAMLSAGGESTLFTLFEPANPVVCPTLPLEAVLLDGAVLPEFEVFTGGMHLSAEYGVGCAGIGINALLSSTTTRDGELSIDSAGSRVSYVGRNLVANRGVVLLDDSTDVAAGESVRFRLEPQTDVLDVLHFVTLNDGVTVGGKELEGRIEEDGAIAVTVPSDTPAGLQTLSFSVDAHVQTVECEGFSSCDVAVQLNAETQVTVDVR